MLMTKRPTTKQSEDPSEIWNAKIRLAEQALLRIDAGLAEPGDVARVAEVGWSDLAEQKRQLERLHAVQLCQSRVESAADIQRSRDTFHEVEPRVRAAVAVIAIETEKLRARLSELDSEKRTLTNELTEAERDLQYRTTHLEKLRSTGLLPPHVVQEIAARTRSVNAATATRQRELSELIAGLKADGSRLAQQTDASGYISSAGQLQEYADRAARTVTHRAHLFWRDRVFSHAEWSNFNAWCQSRAAEYQSELDAIKAGVKNELADELERLTGFYASAFE